VGTEPRCSPGYPIAARRIGGGGRRGRCRPHLRIDGACDALARRA
jgi:hypothetical protein